MDLSTGHMAYTVHTQDARRAEQQREFRRVAEERAVELAASERASRSSFRSGCRPTMTARAVGALMRIMMTVASRLR